MGNVLVVDDSLTERKILTAHLEGEGLSVIFSTSGEDALEKIKSETPDLIVLDVVLPGRSGFEVCRELKSNDETKGIPIILCSTKGSEMDKFWGMKQGANAYIPKPVDKEELIKTVTNLIKK